MRMARNRPLVRALLRTLAHQTLMPHPEAVCVYVRTPHTHTHSLAHLRCNNPHDCLCGFPVSLCQQPSTCLPALHMPMNWH